MSPIFAMFLGALGALILRSAIKFTVSSLGQSQPSEVPFCPRCKATHYELCMEKPYIHYWRRCLECNTRWWIAIPHLASPAWTPPADGKVISVTEGSHTLLKTGAEPLGENFLASHESGPEKRRP